MFVVLPMLVADCTGFRFYLAVPGFPTDVVYERIFDYVIGPPGTGMAPGQPLLCELPLGLALTWKEILVERCRCNPISRKVQCPPGRDVSELGEEA